MKTLEELKAVASEIGKSLEEKKLDIIDVQSILMHLLNGNHSHLLNITQRYYALNSKTEDSPEEKKSEV